MATNEKRLEQTGETKWIRLVKMRVSGVAQRKFREARVDFLHATFDLDMLGTPVVNSREGWFYVIDGQHRVEALKRFLGKGWEDQQVQCHVYEGLTEQQEADMFCRYNNQLPVNTFDRFRVAVTAGYAEETAIKKVVEDAKLVISQEKLPGAVGAVGTLKRVYSRSDGETLGKSLRIIRGAFGDAGFEAMVIDGMGHLCQRYNGVLHEDVAINSLGNMHGGVKGLLGKAEVLHKQTGNPKAQCVAAAAVDVINGRKGQKKLPSWWKAQA